MIARTYRSLWRGWGVAVLVLALASTALGLWADMLLPMMSPRFAGLSLFWWLYALVAVAVLHLAGTGLVLVDAEMRLSLRVAMVLLASFLSVLLLIPYWVWVESRWHVGVPNIPG